MGSARFTYLMDLDRKAADAYIRCECGYAVTIPIPVLLRLFRPTTPLDQAGIRLKCSRCGRKGQRIIPVPQSHRKPFRVAKPDASE